jgi:hypothetical protein
MASFSWRKVTLSVESRATVQPDQGQVAALLFPDW